MPVLENALGAPAHHPLMLLRQLVDELLELRGHGS